MLRTKVDHGRVQLCGRLGMAGLFMILSGGLAVAAADQDESAGASWGPALSEKIKIEDGSGKLVFAIKPEDDGAKLVDPAGKEIARYNLLKGDKIKIKDATDHVLGYVIGTGGKYHLKDPAQKAVLYELQRQTDGDWKLEDGHENLIYLLGRKPANTGRCSVVL